MAKRTRVPKERKPRASANRVDNRDNSNRTSPKPKSYSSVLVNITPKTPGQEQYIKAIENNSIVICDGPAGTGKTFISFWHALKGYLHSEEIKRIIIVRPAVTSGDSEPDLGALPGDINDKMSPFIAPLIRDSAPLLLQPETYRKMQGVDPLESLLSIFDIEVVPLHFMRGRTFHNAFVILDEAQNCTMRDFKLFLTRIGRNSKVVVEGDSSQKDKPNGALPELMDRLDDMDNIGIVRLLPSDIIRNPMIYDIIRRLDMSYPG